MDEPAVAHLAGIFDAIGTLTVNISKTDNYSIGYRYRPLIRIQRSRSTNEDLVMGKLIAYCDDEGIYYKLHQEDHTSGEGASTIVTIDSPDDIEKFLEPMLPHLVTKFEPSLMMLRDILPAIREKEHHTKEGFYDLIGAADQLRSFNAQGQDPKYTREYFAEKWSGEIPGTA